MYARVGDIAMDKIRLLIFFGIIILEI